MGATPRHWARGKLVSLELREGRPLLDLTANAAEDIRTVTDIRPDAEYVAGCGPRATKLTSAHATYFAAIHRPTTSPGGSVIRKRSNYHVLQSGRSAPQEAG